jgi:serine O-acetyltransferase
MLQSLQADIERYVLMDEHPWWLLLLTKQGLWAMTQYRFSRWVHFNVRMPLVRQFLKVFCAIWQKLIEIVTGSEFPNRAEIGQGVFIPHVNGIFIHCDAKIGKECVLSQQVAIGAAMRGDNQGCPQLGDRVFVGPGAKIIGNIDIGNDVAIGANAVVTNDIPDNAVAVGIPARVISYKGSDELILAGESSP